MTMADENIKKRIRLKALMGYKPTVIKFNKLGIVLAFLVLLAIFIIAFVFIAQPKSNPVLAPQDSTMQAQDHVSRSELLQQDPAIYLKARTSNDNALALSNEQIARMKASPNHEFTPDPTGLEQTTRLVHAPMTIYRSDGMANNLHVENTDPGDSVKNAQGASLLVNPYQLKAGTLIPAVMISGLNSSLPGFALGQVTQPVYDSLTGQQVLIPQGTRLFLQYDAQMNAEQERLFVKVIQLTLPNGHSLKIENNSIDQHGWSGLHDQVQYHHLRNFIGLFMNTAANLPLIGASAAMNAGLPITQVTNTILPNHFVPPTLKIRPGYLFYILLTADVQLPLHF
jgi:type IV secretory pathway VirB10-like protein